MARSKKQKENPDKLATQRDIELVLGQTQFQFTELRQEIQEVKEEILRHFDAAVEIIHHNLVGENKDEISLLEDKQENHEQRITVLERREQLR